MDAAHRLITRLFDMLLGPFEGLGIEWVILGLGAFFGVFALWVFKLISPQKAIANTKERIKGHLIEIRLYQDDLALVTRAIGKVLWQNLRYLILNFGPFLPLALPFVLVAGQLVVRYGFDPVPVRSANEVVLAGQGITLAVRFDRDSAEQAADLRFQLPAGLKEVSEMVRVPEQGVAFQELVATHPGLHELTLEVDGKETVKRIWAGKAETLGTPRVAMQPVRVQGMERWLWPAEPGLDDLPALAKIEFAYPQSELGWLPNRGPFGVLLWFVVASFIAGILAIKPLRVHI